MIYLNRGAALCSLLRKQESKNFTIPRDIETLVMFDLNRHPESYYRDCYLQDGFDMLQFSVYARHTPSEENATVHIQRVKSNIPEDGHIRILKFTDKQFSRMLVFFGKMRKSPEKASEQLSFF